MHVESLQPANLCLVTLLSSEQCSQFERVRLQHVQMVNKTSSFKTRLMTEASNVNCNTLWRLTSCSRHQTSRYNLLLGQF